MEVSSWFSKVMGLLGKYRYAAVVLLLGLVLLLIPGTKKNTDPTESTISTPELSDEEQLGAILSQIRGAGKVEVLLSYASGPRTEYQTDTNQTGETGTRSDTVTVTDSDRNQTGLVIQVYPAEYLGAIIVCQGADDPSVRLAIVDAVCKYTGLGANQISVLKMK